MGSRHLRLGTLALALGLALMAGATEIGTSELIPALALVVAPLLLMLVGLREVVRGARLRRLAGVVDATASALRSRLPAEYLVIPHYRPRDTGDGEVALVVVGPPGVVVVEPRAEDGEIVCYQDRWFRSTPGGRAYPLDDSPSRRARWNATRVRSDVATGGFVRTPVDAVIVFTRGHLTDSSSSCVLALEGIDALVAHVLREARVEASPQRTRALAEALVGRLRVAVA